MSDEYAKAQRTITEHHRKLVDSIPLLDPRDRRKWGISHADLIERAIPPADPDVLEARLLIRAQMHDRDGSFCDYVEAGLRDDCPEMRIAVAAIKRGRELADG